MKKRRNEWMRRGQKEPRIGIRTNQTNLALIVVPIFLMHFYLIYSILFSLPMKCNMFLFLLLFNDFTLNQTCPKFLVMSTNDLHINYFLSSPSFLSLPWFSFLLLFLVFFPFFALFYEPTLSCHQFVFCALLINSNSFLVIKSLLPLLSLFFYLSQCLLLHNW